MLSFRGYSFQYIKESIIEQLNKLGANGLAEEIKEFCTSKAFVTHAPKKQLEALSLKLRAIKSELPIHVFNEAISKQTEATILNILTGWEENIRIYLPEQKEPTVEYYKKAIIDQLIEEGAIVLADEIKNFCDSQNFLDLTLTEQLQNFYEKLNEIESRFFVACRVERLGATGEKILGILNEWIQTLSLLHSEKLHSSHVQIQNGLSYDLKFSPIEDTFSFSLQEAKLAVEKELQTIHDDDEVAYKKNLIRYIFNAQFSVDQRCLNLAILLQDPKLNLLDFLSATHKNYNPMSDFKRHVALNPKENLPLYGTYLIALFTSRGFDLLAMEISSEYKKMGSPDEIIPPNFKDALIQLHQACDGSSDMIDKIREICRISYRVLQAAPTKDQKITCLAQELHIAEKNLEKAGSTLKGFLPNVLAKIVLDYVDDYDKSISECHHRIKTTKESEDSKPVLYPFFFPIMPKPLIPENKLKPQEKEEPKNKKRSFRSSLSSHLK